MERVCLAKKEYLSRVCEITDQAKRQLKGLGLDQWQSGYPSKEVWEMDLFKNMCYVFEKDEEVYGAFAFQTFPDVSYGEIEGAWLTEGAYASMHRVCVADEAKGMGVAGKMFAAGFAMAKALGFGAVRIDTHPGNLPMQRALTKAGFVKCGEIHLVDGCEAGNLRIAFEKKL